MKLYLVRHGQSEFNLSRLLSGWAQVSLTEQGFADARRVGKYLQQFTFDRIYSSDLLRAVQTAQTALPGCEPLQLSMLREANVGSLQGKSLKKCEQIYGERFWVVPEGSDYRPFGGENSDDVRSRVRSFLRLLESDPCEQVVAFAHEGILRCALDLVLGMNYERHNVRCPNCAVVILTWMNGHWVLEAWNAGA